MFKKTFRIEKRHFIFKVCGDIVDIWCNAEHNSKGGYALHAYLCGFGRSFEHTSINVNEVTSYKNLLLLAAAKLCNSDRIALVDEFKSKSLF